MTSKTLVDFTAEANRLLLDLVTIRDPEILKQYGWKAPYPSYVTATPSLWSLWLTNATHRK